MPSFVQIIRIIQASTGVIHMFFSCDAHKNSIDFMCERRNGLPKTCRGKIVVFFKSMHDFILVN